MHAADFTTRILRERLAMSLRFSQRIGKNPVKMSVQIDSMDGALRVGLWNLLDVAFLEPLRKERLGRRNGPYNPFLSQLWDEHLKLRLDTIPHNGVRLQNTLREIFFRLPWYEAYDFVEVFLCPESPINYGYFSHACNAVLEREMSPYRVVGNVIAPLTNPQELGAIEEALTLAEKTPLTGVSEHLETALAKLSDRTNPDYRNSIKESVSAVESVCIVIAGETKTLGDALKIVRDKIGLHPALQKGFGSIYGYTNEADGIRHALLEESSSDFEDAKFMLVSCSAFINYLIGKAVKAGIDLK